MSDTLHERLVRLAYENPELRSDLLPLLKEAGRMKRRLDPSPAEEVQNLIGLLQSLLRKGEDRWSSQDWKLLSRLLSPSAYSKVERARQESEDDGWNFDMFASERTASFYGDQLRNIGAGHGTDLTQLIGGLSYILTDMRNSTTDEERAAVSEVLSGLNKVQKTGEAVRKLRGYRLALAVLERQYR